MGSGTDPAEIRFQGVSFQREGRRVFSGLSLTLTERRVAIVGRNGSGKSTLARLIAGLEMPERGRVTLGGVEMAQDRQAALAAVGILFQNPDHQIIFPTVEEELAFGLEQQGLSRAAARARVAVALATEGRGDWVGRPSQALSQGERQYLCLLAILLMAPQVILLDEPFAALDIPTARRLEARVARLAQSVVLITHNPARLAGYERLIWLEAGEVAGDGPPAEVLPAYLAEMERLGEEPPEEAGAEPPVPGRATC